MARPTTTEGWAAWAVQKVGGGSGGRRPVSGAAADDRPEERFVILNHTLNLSRKLVLFCVKIRSENKLRTRPSGRKAGGALATKIHAAVPGDGRRQHGALRAACAYAWRHARHQALGPARGQGRVGRGEPTRRRRRVRWERRTARKRAVFGLRSHARRRTASQKVSTSVPSFVYFLRYFVPFP